MTCAGGCTGQSPSAERDQCLDLVEPLGDGVESQGLGQGSDEGDGEDRAGPYQLVGQGLHPPGEIGFAPFAPHPRHGEFHQIGGAAGVVAGQRVADRGQRVVIRLEPGAGPSMQLGDLVRPLVEQVRLQHIGEQVVVAIPLPPVVERDEEEVGPLERDQRGLATRCVR